MKGHNTKSSHVAPDVFGEAFHGLSANALGLLKVDFSILIVAIAKSGPSGENHRSRRSEPRVVSSRINFQLQSINTTAQ